MSVFKITWKQRYSALHRYKSTITAESEGEAKKILYERQYKRPCIILSIKEIEKTDHRSQQ